MSSSSVRRRTRVACLVTLIGLACAAIGHGAEAESWKMQPLLIPTRWATEVRPSNVLPEYPRPQLVRERWQNLNGLWEYTITARSAKPPERYAGHILIPFPLEAPLSGVQKTLRADELLWYRRVIDLEGQRNGARTLLHFGAVDYQATVYVNGQEVGGHVGGYQRFTLDITAAVRPGQNTLIVKAFDPTMAGANPRGKQGSYSPSSGIWQTVWLENVPATYIEDLAMTPDIDRRELRVTATIKGAPAGHTIQAVVTKGRSIVARQTISGETALAIPNPRLWSPDDPFLYDLQVQLLKDGQLIDEVKSYFGMRKIEIREDPDGIRRVLLNGQSIYTLGILDQGFWPDGIYTAPTDAALRFDIQAAKAMGFNTIRKHVKIEPARWYYYCDKLGMLVWQDMINPGNDSEEARAQFEKEIPESMAQLRNHPSIVTWVLFNERWGAYDQRRIAAWMRKLDPSRLLNAHSGPNGNIAQWLRHTNPATMARVFDREFNIVDYRPITEALKKGIHDGPDEWMGGDFIDSHQYPYPELPLARGGVRVVGEYGGIGADLDGHVWKDLQPGFSYLPVSIEQAGPAYADLVERLKRLEAQGLMGSIYTQITDVEQEQNGLMSYDRAVARIPVTELVKMNSRLVPTANNYGAATHGFSLPNADRTSPGRRTAEQLAQYREGRRERPFLRTLALRAMRQADRQQATAVANEYISGAEKPYSPDTWAFIAATTHTTTDMGFEILRQQAAEANRVLGPDTAERRVRAVIVREEVEPLLTQQNTAVDWQALERQLQMKYDVLGAEAVWGTAMIEGARQRDWVNFGRYFSKYMATAVGRSEYFISNLAYTVFEHVSDPKVLEVAIAAVRKTLIDPALQPSPLDLDTYAGLLYKAGRRQEALECQEKAVRLNVGQDRELIGNLAKMNQGLPTWPSARP